MIYLLDDASALYQWDSNREVAIDRTDAAEIAKVHDRDAQLAILFNEHIHPEEYEAYQAFRAECKAAVNAKMATLKAELEAILNQ